MDATIVKLKRAGLAGNEAKLYYLLLERGALSANDLSKKASMDRTLTYTVLNHLIEKGLVSYVIKDKRKIFQPADPENLLNSVKAKEVFIKNLIPTLQKIEKIKDTPQEISIYEGKEGVRTFARLVMKKYNSVSAFGATGKAYDLLYESPAIAKMFERKGFSFRFITTPEYHKHPMTQIKNTQVRFLDTKTNVTTSIFGDYISIHIIHPKPLIILIKNKEISNSYREHFEILWNVAKK